MNLDPGSNDAVANDDGGNWCVSFAGPWASGPGQGSPGAANPGCAIPPSGLMFGSLVISEILNNPGGSDDDREWFEIHNTLGVGVDLQGFTVSDDGFDYHVITLHVVIPAGGYVVIGQSTDPAINGGAPVDYACFTGLALSNSDDEVILTSPEGLEIDAVWYDGGPEFPTPDGASMSLSNTQLDAPLNDVGANWCPATGTPFGSTADLGTPGAANPECL